MDSSFLTYRKSKDSDHPLLDDSDDVGDNNAAYTSVHQTEVESWGKTS